MNDPVELLAAAIADAAPNYAKVTADDLALPTPCHGWDLRTLLNHAFSRLELSTRAARLEPIHSFADVDGDHVGTDPAGAYETMSNELLAAWRACDDMATDRVIPLGVVPPQAVLLFGAQDIFIHAWDVAKACGFEPELSDHLIDVFTETHRQSVDEELRAAFFAEEVAVDDDAEPLDKLVAFLGRQP